MKFIKQLVFSIFLLLTMSSAAVATQATIPYPPTFKKTVSSAQLGSDLTSILNVLNSGIDNTNIGGAGIYANQITAPTTLQGTFPGALYTFPAIAINGLTQGQYLTVNSAGQVISSGANAVTGVTVTSPVTNGGTSTAPILGCVTCVTTAGGQTIAGTTTLSNTAPLTFSSTSGATVASAATGSVAAFVFNNTNSVTGDMLDVEKAGTNVYQILNNGGFISNGNSTINGLLTASDLTDSALTPGDCVQAGTGGHFTTTLAACGSGGGGVTSVTGSAPIVSSGGTTPAISCSTCITTVGGQTIAGTTTFSGASPFSLSNTGTTTVTENTTGANAVLVFNANNASAPTGDLLDLDLGGTKEQAFTNGGGINALGAIAAGSGTGGTLTAGDLGASRSTTTGALRLGGSSNSCLIDYGVSSSFNVTFGSGCNSVQINGNQFNTGYIAAGSGTGATLTSGDLGASRNTTTGKLFLGGSSSSCGADYGVTTSSVFTVGCKFNGTAAIGAGSGTGATLTAGDLGASRSTTTGGLILGGSSSSCLIDYGVSTASTITEACPVTSTGTVSGSSFSSTGGLTLFSGGTPTTLNQTTLDFSSSLGVIQDSASSGLILNNYNASPSWLYELQDGGDYMAKTNEYGELFMYGRSGLWLEPIPTPSTPSLGSSSAGSLSATTYYVVISYVQDGTPFAYSAVSAEASLAVAANHVLTVACPSTNISNTIGAIGCNVSVSTTTNTETIQNSTTPVPLGTTWTEPTSGLVAGATPTATASRSNGLNINNIEFTQGSGGTHCGVTNGAGYFTNSSTAILSLQVGGGAGTCGYFSAASTAAGTQTFVAPVYTAGGAAEANTTHTIVYSCTFVSATTCAVSLTGSNTGQFTSATSYACGSPDMGTATTYVGFTVGNKTASSFTVYASASNSDTVNGTCTGT